MADTKVMSLEGHECDTPILSLGGYEYDPQNHEDAIRRAESREMELRERRSYAIDPDDVLVWMIGIPSCMLFLAACIWAIASN